MHLIDTHAHIYLPDYAIDLEKVIAKSKENGIKKIILPCIDLDSVEPMLEICAKHKNFCFALGEIGMDLYRDANYILEQIKAFENFLELAIDLDLPIIIHCRYAFDNVIKIIKKHQNGKLKGVFHCFGGTIEQALEIIDTGFVLGIGGVLTFTNSKLSKVVSQVGIEHIVLETDSPYLAPVPYRGTRNSPEYILDIAKELAVVKKIFLHEICVATCDNVKKVFNI